MPGAVKQSILLRNALYSLHCTLKRKKKPAYLFSSRAHGDESLRLLETVQRAITLKEINLASRQSRPVSDLIRCPKNVFVTHGWRKKAKLRLFCAKSERLQKGHTSFLRANHAAGWYVWVTSFDNKFISFKRNKLHLLIRECKQNRYAQVH